MTRKAKSWEDISATHRSAEETLDDKMSGEQWGKLPPKDSRALGGCAGNKTGHPDPAWLGVLMLY